MKIGARKKSRVTPAEKLAAGCLAMGYLACAVHAVFWLI